VGKDSVAIGALLGAIAGAALGRYVQKLWASEPIEDDFGERLARLEREIEELEVLQRRSKESIPSTSRAQVPPIGRPRLIPEVRGKPPEQQYLVLTADRDFRLNRIDYVSNQGKTVISEDVEKSGRRIEAESGIYLDDRTKLPHSFNFDATSIWTVLPPNRWFRP